MNRLFKIFALTALMFFGGQAMAQKTFGTMFLGASFPMGDYGKYEDMNSFALTAEKATNTGASVGFNLGLKWYFNVGVKGLNVLLSADGFYNGANEDLKTAYRKGEHITAGTSAWEDFLNNFIEEDFSYKTTPKYINVPIMVGMNYIYHFNPSFGIYVEAGAGGNFSITTGMESIDKWEASFLGQTWNGQVTTKQVYDKPFCFAYQASLGIEVGKNFIVGCSFYDLGNAKAKGDQTVVTVNGDDKPETTTAFKEYGNIHPMMILARIGFKF